MAWRERTLAGLALATVFVLATTVGPTAHTEVNDLYVYSVIAHLLDGGLVPYRDFGFEYPPLALPAIWLPNELGGDPATWLAVEALAAALACQACLAALAGRAAAWWWVLMPVAAGAQARTHFDLVAVAVMLAGLLALARGRAALGGAVLGIGGLVKLFPLLLAPLGRPARRTVAVAACVVVAGSLPFVVLGGYGDLVRFHLDRPVQIESTPAVVTFLAGGDVEVTGAPVRPDPYKSNGVRGGVSGVAEGACLVLLAAALAAAIALAGRDLLLAATLATVAFVAFGKVLSPQYMLWLAPFAALAAARRQWAVAVPLAAAIALTQAWFPVHYFDVVYRRGAAPALVALRDALLILAVATTARALARSPSPRGRPARSG